MCECEPMRACDAKNGRNPPLGRTQCFTFFPVITKPSKKIEDCFFSVVSNILLWFLNALSLLQSWKGIIRPNHDIIILFFILLFFLLQGIIKITELFQHSPQSFIFFKILFAIPKILIAFQIEMHKLWRFIRVFRSYLQSLYTLFTTWMDKFIIDDMNY